MSYKKWKFSTKMLFKQWGFQQSTLCVDGSNKHKDFNRETLIATKMSASFYQQTLGFNPILNQKKRWQSGWENKKPQPQTIRVPWTANQLDVHSHSSTYPPKYFCLYQQGIIGFDPIPYWKRYRWDGHKTSRFGLAEYRELPCGIQRISRVGWIQSHEWCCVHVCHCWVWVGKTRLVKGFKDSLAAG